MTELNGNKHFSFEDDNHQTFDIYSNEHNTGVGLACLHLIVQLIHFISARFRACDT